jgi:ribosomal-protein-alanine N-acetyltransferase
MVFRPLRADDREQFSRVWQASWPTNQPWFPEAPADRTPEGFFEEQLQRTANGLASQSEYRLVGRLSDGTLAAFVNLFQIVRGVGQTAMASWWVNSELRGQGYGSEGVGVLLDFAFAPEPQGLGLHRVQANVIPTNIASIRVAEKNGFRREGLALRYVKIAGEWQDHVMFAKLVDEHLANRRG